MSFFWYFARVNDLVLSSVIAKIPEEYSDEAMKLFRLTLNIPAGNDIVRRRLATQISNSVLQGERGSPADVIRGLQQVGFQLERLTELFKEGFSVNTALLENSFPVRYQQYCHIPFDEHGRPLEVMYRGGQEELFQSALPIQRGGKTFLQMVQAGSPIKWGWKLRHWNEVRKYCQMVRDNPTLVSGFTYEISGGIDQDFLAWIFAQNFKWLQIIYSFPLPSGRTFRATIKHSSYDLPMSKWEDFEGVSEEDWRILCAVHRLLGRQGNVETRLSEFFAPFYHSILVDPWCGITTRELLEEHVYLTRRLLQQRLLYQ